MASAAITSGHLKKVKFHSSFSLLVVRFKTTSPTSTQDLEKLIRQRCKSPALELEEALHLFNRLILIQSPSRPSPSTFNHLLGLITKKFKSFSTVVSLIKTMNNVGIQPDAFHSYHLHRLSIPFGLCASGCFSEAMELFGKMEKDGLQADVVTYNIIIDNMCKVGKLKDARELFCSLPAKGLLHDVIMYHTMIKGFYKEGMLNDAQHLFTEMEKKGFAPDSCTFNIMIQEFLKKNDVHNAVQFLKAMRKKGFAADALTTSVIINQLAVDDSKHECKTDLRKFMLE